MEIAYHASHEQFSPSQLLQLVKKAEAAGFDAIHSSDHFHPWISKQGNSGFAFSWIAAAMQVCQLPFSMICAPGQRLHPAIAAQAIATIAELFPNRFSVELGSGEAINESITGEQWPDKEIRNQRLKECADIIRTLISGAPCSYDGHVKVNNARLFSLPAQPPPLFGAAITSETAEWLGSWADGLITTGQSVEEIREKLHCFRKTAGEVKPVYVKYSFSYHPDYSEALQGAFDQWPTLMLMPGDLADFDSIEKFENATNPITIDEFEKKLEIFTEFGALRSKIEEFASTGINRIILHNLNREQELFLKDFSTGYT